MPTDNQKVNVLGTTYTITYKDYKEVNDFKAKGACGFCDSVTKEILICIVKTYPEFKDVSELYATKMTKEILRHELFHAYLAESGLAEDSIVYESGWATNEEMVDWFAKQAPKIFKTFEKLDIL